ncbi:LPD1 domain-containing protein [Niallia sp. FSL R7-0271]|uniref:LPD1 domain-containing protein n=1 Tax=Niallia sp. FSL R7-0271 TaxID=2921678 RepID=UPI0030FA5F1B
MTNQLSLFMDMEQNNTEIRDIRTDKQTTNKVSYDVGELINGSRKELAELRKAFEEKQSSELLEEIEKVNPLLSEELISKQQFFKHFSLENEKAKGTEPAIAKLKQLILNRVDKVPANQTREGRKAFMIAAQYLLSCMEELRGIDDVAPFINRLGKELNTERRQKEAYLGPARLSVLGGEFRDFYLKRGYQSSFKTAFLINTWDELLNKNTAAKPKKKSSSWFRELPERPDRTGGHPSYIEKPEDLISFFGFRGVQFGNYVDDEKAMEHLIRSSDAMMDLADILGSSSKSLSLDGTLAMAYGARGRGGQALAHYEPLSRVINMTKNKGSLGVLAHEWWHALDHYIYCLSHGDTSRRGYASNVDTLGSYIDIRVKNAYEELVTAIRSGNSIAYIKNTNSTGVSYRGLEFRKIYRNHNRDLLASMEEYTEMQKIDLEESLEMEKYYGIGDIAEKKKKLITIQQRDLKKFALSLAWLHEKETGDRVEKIPYPSQVSNYVLASMKLDKGKKPYWADIIELTARAFESYIQDKLLASNRVSDYLVAGTKDPIAFPIGIEREAINKQFEYLLTLLREQEII